MQLHGLEPFFQMFYSIVRKNFSSCQLRFLGNNIIADKYMENLKKASGKI